MTGNIKALLDLHISVRYLIIRKLALFHDTPAPYWYIHKHNLKDNVET